MRPLIIGIAGGSGSGKTTLVERLCEQFGEDVSVLTHASYYTPRPDLTDEERDGLNLDHPASFDTDRLISDLEDLIAGKTVQVPVYDFAIQDRLEETRTLSPTKIILVEGMLILENKALRNLLDIKLFVDTDDDVRLLRRLLRFFRQNDDAVVLLLRRLRLFRRRGLRRRLRRLRGGREDEGILPRLPFRPLPGLTQRAAVLQQHHRNRHIRHARILGQIAQQRPAQKRPARRQQPRQDENRQHAGERVILFLFPFCQGSPLLKS